MSHFVAYGSLFGPPFLSHPCRIDVAPRYDKMRQNRVTCNTAAHNPDLITYLLRMRKIKKRKPFDFRFLYPLRGSIALLQAQSCAHLVYTLPTSLEGRSIQGSHPSGYKKREELSFFSSVPPQGLEPWTPTLRVSCSTN